MTRRNWLLTLTALASAPVAAIARSLYRKEALMLGEPAQKAGSEQISKLTKAPAEWRKLLSRNEYAVLFEEATEPPGTSPLNQEKRKGLFVCAACYLPLFDSASKFESGTGWPSFFTSLAGRVGTKTDYKLVVPRVEYHCIRCGGHQGHVFEDGPPPTGLRYCNNGVALRFVADGEEPPALRT